MWIDKVRNPKQNRANLKMKTDKDQSREPVIPEIIMSPSTFISSYALAYIAHFTYTRCRTAPVGLLKCTCADCVYLYARHVWVHRSLFQFPSVATCSFHTCFETCAVVWPSVSMQLSSYGLSRKYAHPMSIPLSPTPILGY